MPINVANGNVHLEFEELSIPGKVNLIWERRYSGNLLSRPSGILGFGWTCRYEATLRRSAQAFEFFTPGGSVEVLPDVERAVERGRVIRSPGAFLEIFLEDGRYIVRNWNVESGEVQRYCFVPNVPGSPMPLASIENLTGQGLDLERDQTGRLKAIRQRLEQRALKFDYFTSGLLRSVTVHAPTGQSRLVARYEYQADGRLSAAFDARGFADRYEYDATGRLVREMARDGGVFSYRYDEKGRCIRYSGLDRYDEKRFRFLETLGITEIADSYGATTRYRYLPTGQIVSEWSPTGAETRTEYDENGRVSTRIKSTGAVTRYVYDERGNRCGTINALEQAYILTFDDCHQVTSLTDPAGQVWRRRYDSQHRPIATIGPSGERWDLQYDSLGNVISFSNPKGAMQHFGYRNGVPAENSDWLGNISRVEFDLLGRLTMRIDPLGNVFHYHYDASGNLIQIGLPDGADINVAYDSGGNITRLTNAMGRATSYRYGTCQRLLETIDANGDKINFFWGTEPGRLERVENQRGEIYRFVYNEWGQCIEEIGFDGRHLQFKYDSASRCAETTNGVGETALIERDLLDRTVGKKLSDGQEIRFVYDSVGNLIEANNPDCAIRMERDVNGRLLREFQTTVHGEHWIRYTRDALGDTIRMETDLGLRVDYETDANRRVKSLRTDAGHITQFRYDARGGEIQRWLPGGVALDQEYDAVGRLITQRLGRYWGLSSQREPTDRADLFSDTLMHRGYLRNASGLVTRITDELSGVAQFSYDPAERLLQVLRDRGPIERFQYDIAGSLKRTVTDNLGEVEDEVLSYGQGSRLTRIGRTRYEHDNQGRLVRKFEDTDSMQPNTWSYGWDALDQLVTVTRPDGETWNYKYDAFQRRILKTGPAVHTAFLWAGDLPVHELQLRSKEWTGWLFHRHSFSPLGFVRGTNYFSIVTDHLGTPQELVSNSGRVLPLQKTLAYGKSPPLPISVDLCPFRFPGHYYDMESGLHYSRFRYYEPGVGSFISQDPIRLLGNIDLYRYSNDPANEIDPFGLSTSSDSKILGNNLTASGEPPTNPGAEDAHHIVMSNSSNTGMQELRDTMANYNPPIDINDPRNGVWLPRDAAARDNGDPRTLHKGDGVHSDDYKESVHAELMAGNPKPPSRRTFLARLQKLKNALNSGRTFKCKG
jgi:RHS repeat-associated protein